jgi:hypothetical protein
VGFSPLPLTHDRSTPNLANFVAAPMARPASSRDLRAHLDGSRAIADGHTVKVKSFALITLDLAVTTTVVKGLDDAQNRHGFVSDP